MKEVAAEQPDSLYRIIRDLVDHLLQIGLTFMALVSTLYDKWDAATFYLLAAWFFAWMQKNRWAKTRPAKTLRQQDEEIVLAFRNGEIVAIKAR